MFWSAKVFRVKPQNERQVNFLKYLASIKQVRIFTGILCGTWEPVIHYLVCCAVEIFKQHYITSQCHFFIEFWQCAWDHADIKQDTVLIPRGFQFSLQTNKAVKISQTNSALKYMCTAAIELNGRCSQVSEDRGLHTILCFVLHRVKQCTPKSFYSSTGGQSSSSAEFFPIVLDLDNAKAASLCSRDSATMGNGVGWERERSYC